MDQVVRNLLSNALKFSNRGETITIRTGFCPHKKTIPHRIARQQTPPQHHHVVRKTRFHKVLEHMSLVRKSATPTTLTNNDNNNHNNNNNNNNNNKTVATDDTDGGGDEWIRGDLIVIVKVRFLLTS